MSVTVGSTGITFPDSTTQTTAATGGVTSITAGTGITTSGSTGAVTVNVATTLGAVGTYAFLAYSSSISAGTSYSGASLNYAGMNSVLTGSPCYYVTASAVSASGSAPAGTWKAMGNATSNNGSYVTLFLRTV
jgi:hypothetical protein